MTSAVAPRTGHPFHMHDAIYAQPGALRLVSRGNESVLDAAAERLREAARVVLVGVGSSWHAALVGEALLAHAGRLGPRVRATHGFEQATYGPPVDPDTVVVLISHGGGSRAVAAVLAAATRSGATSIAVTGKGHDAFAAATYTLRTVDRETSSTHTVGYTTALALLAALAARVGGDAALERELRELPDHVATLLGQEAWDDLAARYGGRRQLWVVGGGPSRATAYEAAMKLQEATYAAALGLEIEQFLHGPWAAVDAGDLLVIVAPPGPSHDRCVAAARVARAVGAAVLAIADESDEALGPLASELVALPPVPELVSPIASIVPLQLFTYHLALARGANPDTMRTHEPPYGRARAALDG